MFARLLRAFASAASSESPNHPHVDNHFVSCYLFRDSLAFGKLHSSSSVFQPTHAVIHQHASFASLLFRNVDVSSDLSKCLWTRWRYVFDPPKVTTSRGAATKPGQCGRLEHRRGGRCSVIVQRRSSTENKIERKGKQDMASDRLAMAFNLIAICSYLLWRCSE